MVSSGCPTNDLGLLFVRMLRRNRPRSWQQRRVLSPWRASKKRRPMPAWRAKPSWYLVAEENRMINPVTQRFLAGRMGAQARSEKVDHTPLVTAPGLVVEMILQAVTSRAHENP